MRSIRARLAQRLGLRYVACGARISRNVRLGRRVSIARGVELVASASGPIVIGDDSFIHRDALLHTYGGSITVGRRVGINAYCIVYGAGGVVVGDDCLIAAFTVIVASSHIFTRRDVPIQTQGITHKGVTIGSDVWLGTRVTVLDGVSIGDGAVIGAGAVVTRDIPPFTIAAGVPARVIRARP